MDIAVRNDKGEYVLGVECDSALYAESRNSRERDVHRHKYLTGRGWRLFRVWSHEWWRDANEVVAQIKRLVV